MFFYTFRYGYSMAVNENAVHINLNISDDREISHDYKIENNL